VRVSVGKFVQLDGGERLSTIRVIAQYVIFDLVVVRESQFAVRALVYRLVYTPIVARRNPR
jgi:hypothetical protein